MDMLKMIQRMTDIENEEKRKNLTESALGECGATGMMPPAENLGNPVTMSVTLNASGKDHVTDLMTMLKAAGLEKAEPVGPGTMPMRQDMDRLGAIMRNSEMGDEGVEEEDLEEYTNEPDEAYMDQPKGGGINRRKDMYADAESGDNAMAVKNEEKMRQYIKSKLLHSLEEKKAKPDFLDADKDGNKKEPMKKAMKDKKKVDEGKSKSHVVFHGDKGESKVSASNTAEAKEKAMKKWKLASTKGISAYPADGSHSESVNEKKEKPDFLDVDKDGNKKEPMKKAVADKGNKKGKVPPQFKKKTNEAEVQVPNHEMGNVARKAASMAQVIKRKINSGEEMDDRDYNQMAELGTTLSRVGTNFGPKSMKDVLNHMIEYTDDRNQEGHDYPEFTVDRFKELLAMAKSTGESMVGEKSSELAKRYTKRAQGINMAKKRMN